MVACVDTEPGNAVSPRILAIHGVPTSPGLWSRLALAFPVDAPPLAGLATEAVPARWDMGVWLDALRPRVDADTWLVGHDLGGILAAMLATERPVRGVVLCATSLSPLFGCALRATAWPLVWRYFYRRHGGRRFLTGGLPITMERDAVDTFLDAAPSGFPERMRATARALRIPRDLVARLRDTSTRVSMIWGRRDPWYPLPLARRLAGSLGARLTVLEAGHLAPWEAPRAFSAVIEAIVQDAPFQGAGRTAGTSGSTIVPGSTWGTSVGVIPSGRTPAGAMDSAFRS